MAKSSTTTPVLKQSRRGAELPSDVIVLCKACHVRFRGVTNGKVTRMPVKS